MINVKSCYVPGRVKVSFDKSASELSAKEKELMASYYFGRVVPYSLNGKNEAAFEQFFIDFRATDKEMLGQVFDLEKLPMDRKKALINVARMEVSGFDFELFKVLNQFYCFVDFVFESLQVNELKEYNLQLESIHNLNRIWIVFNATRANEWAKLRDMRLGRCSFWRAKFGTVLQSLDKSKRFSQYLMV